MKIISSTKLSSYLKLVVVSLIINLITCADVCFAQNVKSDSLENIVKITDQDTTKVNALNALFLQYEFTDYEKAKNYLNKALELSEKIGYKKGLSVTYTYFGYFAEDEGDYPNAMKNYFAALKISTAIGDKNGIASSYNNIGNVYVEKGNYPEALKNYFLSLKIREAINDKTNIAASYNNIGIVYYNQFNYPAALKNHLASLKIKEMIGDKKGIGYSYNNIGNVYSDQGNYPEALKNYFACLKIKEEIGDKKGIASAYNNIGLVYYAQALSEPNQTIRMDKLGQSLKSHLASLKIKETIGDKAGIATSYSNLGNVYTKQQKFNLAEEYLVKAKELSIKIGYKKWMSDTYKALTELYSAKGNYKGAFENHKLYILYRDSLDNEETRKQTIQNQMNFDFEKREAVAEAEHKKEFENQKALADEKSRKQKIVLFFVLGSLLLVIVFAGFIFRSLRVTRKQKNIIELQKGIVEHQKKEVEEQKLLVEEKQKEIIDSITYARRIQQSLLPTEKYIERTLKRLLKK